MDQDQLTATLTPFVVLIAILTWSSVVLLYFSFNKALNKIATAQSEKDMVTFRCETVLKRMNFTKKFHKYFLILFILVLLNYVFGLVLRGMLLHERPTGNFYFYENLVYIIRPFSVLTLFSYLGCLTMTKMAQSYFVAIVNKCHELGLFLIQK